MTKSVFSNDGYDIWAPRAAQIQTTVRTHLENQAGEDIQTNQPVTPTVPFLVADTDNSFHQNMAGAHTTSNDQPTSYTKNGREKS